MALPTQAVYEGWVDSHRYVLWDPWVFCYLVNHCSGFLTNKDCEGLVFVFVVFNFVCVPLCVCGGEVKSGGHGSWRHWIPLELV